MKERRPRRTSAWVLLVAVASLALHAIPAAANSFQGLGIVVAAMFAEIPAALLLLISIIISLVLRRRTATKARRIYAGIILFLVPVLVLAGPAVAFAFEGNFILKVLGFFILIFCPALVLGIISMLLALGLRGNAGAIRGQT